MRDSFVFYRSFFDACGKLSDSDRLAVYDAICSYALDGLMPEDSGIVSAMMMLICPQIDANNKRYENGKKGGRPEKEETKPKPKNNQAETKQKPKRNQTITKPEPNVNVNVDVDVNANENANENGNANGDVNVFKTISSEPSEKTPELEADVEAIPLNDGTEWRPSVDEYHEYKRLYPSVDIDQEFRSMRGWSKSNPTKRKTKTGVRRFVTSWLEKEQDRGGRASPTKSTPTDYFIRVANGGEL